MKNHIKKGMSGLLAFLMCFTVLLSAGVTPAFAASETCTTYSVGFPRDGDANQVYSNEVWGSPVADTYERMAFQRCGSDHASLYEQL